MNIYENLYDQAREYSWENYEKGKVLPLTESTYIIDRDTLVKGLREAYLAGFRAGADKRLESDLLTIPSIYSAWVMAGEGKADWKPYAKFMLEHEQTNENEEEQL